MNLYVSHSRNLIYITGTTDLRELIDILTVYSNKDKLEEFSVKCGPSITTSEENTYDYSIDLNDENTKNINFA